MRRRVSIHAPRCRGAMPIVFSRWLGCWSVSIHAPRCRGAMRVRADYLVDLPMFQSTPPVAGGRCPFGDHLCKRDICFNPRPPLPGGDAFSGNSTVTHEGVSIHAPRCRGAMHCFCSGHGDLSKSFNPRPPLPGGDATEHYTAGAGKISFNPRPPLPGGDAFHCPGHCRLHRCVSIHAPRCRGAMR